VLLQRAIEHEVAGGDPPLVDAPGAEDGTATLAAPKHNQKVMGEGKEGKSDRAGQNESAVLANGTGAAAAPSPAANDIEMAKVAEGAPLPSIIPGTGESPPPQASSGGLWGTRLRGRRAGDDRDRTESELESVNYRGYGLGPQSTKAPQFDGYPPALFKHAPPYFPPADELYEDPSSEPLQLTVHGPPQPPADFTYKLKIFVTWLQIATKIASGLQVQWPGAYKHFILWFNVAVNFDFLVLNASSVECVADTDYYAHYVIVMLVPPFLFLGCVGLYLVPNQLRKWCYSTHTDEQRARNKFRFYKVLLYLLFLVYPGVSSMVLRHYVCIPIDGDDSSYLVYDLQVKCFDARWTRYAIGSLVLLLVYPLGIPALFGVILYRSRRALYRRSQPIIKQMYGVLYAGYRMPLWWWELIDMAHKLFLTSILAVCVCLLVFVVARFVVGASNHVNVCVCDVFSSFRARLKCRWEWCACACT
jgi:hypothetical protein